jgi:hypothetical protein
MLRAARPQTFSRLALFPPRRALHGAARTIRGCDLPRREVPVLFMPPVGLTLSLPQRIGTLSDLFVLLPIHGQYPHTSSDKTNSVVGRSQTAPGLQPGAACLPHASARMRTNRLLPCRMVAGDHEFESRFLQRRVRCEPIAPSGSQRRTSLDRMAAYSLNRSIQGAGGSGHEPR